MTTEEHLKKIKAKCESLLAIAEKRTPGEWTLFHQQGERPGIECGDTSIVIIGREDDFADDGGVRGRDDVEAIHNAAFIASCAGTAEAGWRSTIAAIDALLEIYDQPNEQIAHDIITAWPEEIL